MTTCCGLCSIYKCKLIIVLIGILGIRLIYYGLSSSSRSSIHPNIFSFSIFLVLLVSCLNEAAKNETEVTFNKKRDGLSFLLHRDEIFQLFWQKWQKQQINKLAVASVAQLVKNPQLRSLKEMQLIQHVLDSRLRHRNKGKNPSHAICGIVKQNTYT